MTQEVLMAKLEFPERVWEPTERGWASRPVTPEERKERAEKERRWPKALDE